MVNTTTLSQLSQLGKELNSDSNSVNAAIESLNEQLREMNLGVGAWIEISGSGFKLESQFEGARKYRDITLLGFCRFEDEWQLTINEQRVYFVLDPEDHSEVDELFEEDLTALLKASRHLRIAAVAHFDELLDALKAEAERTLAGVKRAKELVRPTKDSSVKKLEAKIDASGALPIGRTLEAFKG
jgi:hypothetical protein